MFKAFLFIVSSVITSVTPRSDGDVDCCACACSAADWSLICEREDIEGDFECEGDGVFA